MKQYLHYLVRSLFLFILSSSILPVSTNAGTGTPPSNDRITEATKYVKVNIYGGTNPYSNAEWNNWNVVASKSVSALAYSDASASSIGAVFNSSYGQLDNGSTYGSGMAPAEVLRYGSYGIKRTMTLTGLSPAKTYDLELYASRGNMGNSTVFTIGTTSSTIVTDYNKTNKAIFTGLTPNSSGQLVITIDKVGTYNYFNGFILTENGDSAPAANQLPTANAGPDKSMNLPANSTTLSGSGTDPDGSIVSYAWSQISGPNTATLTNAQTATATASALVQGVYVFRLTVTDNNNATATDDINVAVNSETVSSGTSSAKVIKVNMYGGTNPYNNTEWNNWNVVASKSVSALNYSDASASTVGAVFNSSYGQLDNGSTYGGTMAPPEVLRYGSYGIKRTLTLSGLSTTKTYDLELYASRGNTGNSTIFTIGTTTITIVTDYNKTNKAIFTGLVPNSSGEIVITIDKTGTYNYVNGFILTEADGGTPPANQLPTANAGTDQTITLPTSTATLSGSGTDADGSITAYAWIQVSGPSTATLTNAQTATATASDMVQGFYVFRLTVTDNNNATATDDITITVNSATGNTLPTANAGLDQTLTLPTNSTNLSGSGSDADGSITAYAWSQVSGPSTATLTNASAAAASVSNLVQGTYIFRLTVTDNSNATASDEVSVIVNPAPSANQPPTANAGFDQAITLPTNSTTLSGSGSDGDGTIIAYLWSQVSGPNTATLSNASTATAGASGLVQGTYVFRLKVTDNSNATATDDVSVTVSQGTTVTLGVFSPSDPVVTYDSTKPPVKPATGVVGKWVRTVRLTWATTAFKCYIYNNMAFRLKFPKNYDSTKSYPLLVFFHGLGEYGTIYDNEYQLYHGGLQHNNAVDDGRFNGFLLYPQSTTEQWSTGNIANVFNLLEKVMIPQGLVDPFRVYVDGLSAGGNTAWTFMRKYSRLVAAATPISSANSAYADSVQKYKFTPIYHFQGGLDTSPMPSAAHALGSKILSYGGNYRYKEYANRGHDCWYLAWAEPDYYAFYAQAHKANPWPLYGRTAFCQGESFRDTLGVTPGFDGYEWRKDGVVLSGATTNYIVATSFGTYDCRVKRGGVWSPWSPRPVVLSVKAPTVQPTITTSVPASNVIPAPDGATAVPLEVPEGYESYSWVKEGSSTVLSTTRLLSATTPGNYKVQVTEKYGCATSTNVVAVPATATRTEAENYTAISGARAETCSDVGGGQDVGYIDLDDWIDYTIKAPTTGNYTIKFRLASAATGAQFQVRTAGDLALTTVSVPNTGNWQKYVDVTSTLYLKAGAQTLRLYSIAVPRFNINYFDLTNPPGTSGTADGFSQPFLVVNANGTNPPDPASNLVSTSTSKYGIQLTWDQTTTPANNETGFEVYEATASDGPYTYRGVTGPDANATTVGNLTPGTTYFYKIRAVNNTAAAAIVGPTTTATSADKNAPTTPTSLRLGTIGKTSVELLWNASTDDVGVAYYDVYVNGVKMYVVAGNLIKATIYNLLPNKDYTFYIQARDAAGNLSASSNQVSAKTLSGSVTQDPSMGTNPKNYSVYINLNVDNPATSPWNNTNSLPYEGLVFKNFKTYGNNYSGAALTLVENFSGYNPGGMNTGNNSGVYPDNVMRSAYYCDKGVTARVQVSGLSVRHTYSFVFFGSRSGTGDRTSVYTIGNRSVSLNAANNTTTTVQLDNVVPDENGTVTYTVSLGAAALYAYQNALVIKAYSLDAATTSTQAVTAAPVVVEQQDSTTAPVALAQALPNPVQGSQVMVRVPLSQPTPELRLSLSDAVGSVLGRWRFTGLQQGVWQQPLQLPSGAWQPGMYLLRIEGLPGGKSQTLKLLKEK